MTNRTVYLLSILLLLSFISLSTTRCIHDKLNYTLKKLDYPIMDIPTETLEDGGNDSEQQSRMLFTAQSMRIYVDYSNLNIAAGANRDFITNVLMPATVSFYSKALKVNYPPSKNLYFPKSFATKCADAVIPSYLQSQSTAVAADLVLFVTASSDTDENYIAYAVPCFQDDYASRVVAGQIHFNLEYLDPSDPTELLSQISTVLHETCHVLGFSNDLFEDFVDPNTVDPTTKKLKKLGTSNVVKTLTRNGVSITSIILPSVLSKAQTYFKCGTLDGLDLEDQGGDGSAGSHWERKILWNEVMTASDLVDIRYSQFTLALLEGTGWYTPDYTVADPLTWGQGEGCSFITSKCIVNKAAAFNEFCTPSLSASPAQGCSWGGQYKGTCAMTGTAAINSNYNYFGDNSKALDPFVNNCPYYFPYTYLGTCTDPTSSNKGSKYFPEVFGDASSCFQVTLSSTASALTSVDTGCFNSQCSLTGSTYTLTVTVGSQTVVCTGAASKKTITGYKGYFYCPDANSYCASRAGTFCNYKCLGRGTCNSGTCVCNDGWTGDGCATRKLVAGCSKCSGKTPNCYGDLCVSEASGVILRVGLMGLFGLIVTFFLV